VSHWTLWLILAAALAWEAGIIALMGRFNRPLRITPDGSRFEGRYADWRVETITGRVADLRREKHQSIYANEYSAATRVTYHTDLLLIDANGRYIPVSVPASASGIYTGHDLAVCYGVRGGRWHLFAVLNHTTGVPILLKLEANRIYISRGFLGFLFVLVALPSLGVILYLILAHVMADDRLTEFGRGGITPLWQSTRPGQQGR
jgi:hypothetical protein